MSKSGNGDLPPRKLGKIPIRQIEFPEEAKMSIQKKEEDIKTFKDLKKSIKKQLIEAIWELKIILGRTPTQNEFTQFIKDMKEKGLHWNLVFEYYNDLVKAARLKINSKGRNKK